jgi:hypothetical protein
MSKIKQESKIAAKLHNQAAIALKIKQKFCIIYIWFWAHIDFVLYGN